MCPQQSVLVCQGLYDQASLMKMKAIDIITIDKYIQKIKIIHNPTRMSYGWRGLTWITNERIWKT